MWMLNLKFRLFVVIIFLVAGAFLFIKGISIEKNMYASRNWPSVKGKIIKSTFTIPIQNRRTIDNKLYYTPRIEYAYAVNGKEYTSERIALGLKGSSKGVKEIYERFLDHYPKDSVADVYYDPANPATAVLEPGLDTGNVDLYYILAALSVLCGIFLIINVFTGLGDSFIENNFCRE